jgi:glycosyltransferase involved in cell wall biosynthesis
MSKHRFVVVIPSYNNKDWYVNNLESVLSQKYDNFRVLYTDDCSPDDTGMLVQKYIDENKTNKITLVRNEKRLGAMENMFNMAHSCDDDEIIVVLDGDDWFAHDGVIQRLSDEYDKDIWMTYGQFKEYPGYGTGCSRQVPDHVKQNGNYRRFRWCSSHLRTYYSWLFKKIKKEDLMVDGRFFTMSSDLAAMFPMLEMSGFHHSFIPDILYIYNCKTPLNDSKIDLKGQQKLEFYIRGKSPYPRLNESHIR